MKLPENGTSHIIDASIDNPAITTVNMKRPRFLCLMPASWAESRYQPVIPMTMAEKTSSARRRTMLTILSRTIFASDLVRVKGFQEFRRPDLG